MTRDAVKMSNFWISVSQEGRDISQEFMAPVLSGGSVAVEGIIPVSYSKSINGAVNHVLAAFQHMDAKDILDQQFFVAMMPGSVLGMEIYLTIMDNHPFLTVDRATQLSFPLGQSKYADMLREAPNVELFFASDLMNFYSYANRNSGEDKKLNISKFELASWYKRFLVGDKLEGDLEKALQDGVLEEDTAPSYSQQPHYRVASNLSWVPPIAAD